MKIEVTVNQGGACSNHVFNQVTNSIVHIVKDRKTTFLTA